MKIAVVGGTGLVGKMVAEQATATGDDVVVVARSTGADLLTGAGLDAALAGADAVIDVSNIVTVSRRKSIAFFTAAGENLLAAEARAGVAHHLCLSIVGVDDVNWGYYYGKRAQEKIAFGGPIPTTVLRATQFHEFAEQFTQQPGGIAVVPKMLSQPIAAREVAAALVAAAHRPPAGLLPDLAGPEQLVMGDMVRRLLRARGSRRPVFSVGLPGAGGRGLARGGLLPQSDGPRGVETFDRWLANFPIDAGQSRG